MSEAAVYVLPELVSGDAKENEHYHSFLEKGFGTEKGLAIETVAGAAIIYSPQTAFALLNLSNNLTGVA